MKQEWKPGWKIGKSGVSQPKLSPSGSFEPDITRVNRFPTRTITTYGSGLNLNLTQSKARALSSDSALIPGTQFSKVEKLLARYVEFNQFKDADTGKGYFCANCVYFYEGKNECAIVKSEGESADGQNSEHIAPFGMCALWKNPSVTG